MKLTRSTLGKLLVAVLALMIAAAPCSLANQSSNASIALYPQKMIGFATENTRIYAKPSELSASINVGRGFPVFVKGSAGPFYVVENAAGVTGYAMKAHLSPTLPSGADPFTGGYDPGWERTSCLLMLPEGVLLRSDPSMLASAMRLNANTPAEVLGRSGDFYLVRNVENDALAFLYARDLVARAATFSWLV